MRSIIFSLASSTAVMAFAMADESGLAAGTVEPTDPAEGDFTNQTSGVLPEYSDKKGIKNIVDAIGGHRVIFDSLELAVKKLEDAAKKTESFYGLPIVMCDQKNFVPGTVVSVATLGTRIKPKAGEKGTGVNAIRAITIMPLPTVDAFIEQTKDWVSKLVIREAADANFSGLRASATVEEAQAAINQVMLTPEQFASSSNLGMDVSAFDDNWNDFKAAFVAQHPAFAEHIPGKGIVMRAFRSASYAKANPYTEGLESKGYWVKILKMFIAALKNSVDAKTKESNDIDTSVLESWLETRDSLELTYSEPAAPKAVDALVL